MGERTATGILACFIFAAVGCRDSGARPAPDCSAFELRRSMTATLAHGPERGAVALPSRQGDSNRFVSAEVLATACDMRRPRVLEQDGTAVLVVELSEVSAESLRRAMHERQGVPIAVTSHGVVNVPWSSARLEGQRLQVHMSPLSLDEARLLARGIVEGTNRP